MKELSVRTIKAKQVIDITDVVEEFLDGEKAKDGMVNIFVTHTTAAITTADLDPGTDLDMLDAFEAMVPKLRYRHPHDPSHVPDHILSSLIGTSLNVPVKAGSLLLGVWQRIVLIELDGLRERRVILSFQPL